MSKPEPNLNKFELLSRQVDHKYNQLLDISLMDVLLSDLIDIIKEYIKHELIYIVQKTCRKYASPQYGFNDCNFNITIKDFQQGLIPYMVGLQDGNQAGNYYRFYCFSSKQDRKSYCEKVSQEIENFIGLEQEANLKTRFYICPNNIAYVSIRKDRKTHYLIQIPIHLIPDDLVRVRKKEILIQDRKELDRKRDNVICDMYLKLYKNELKRGQCVGVINQRAIVFNNWNECMNYAIEIGYERKYFVWLQVPYA